MARGELDRPVIVEFDDEAVLIEERRPGNLAAVVKIDRRARIIGEAAGHIPVPAEFAIFDREITGERHEKSVGHRVDDRRAPFDRGDIARWPAGTLQWAL